MVSPLPPLTAGDVVSGRYRLESHLGSGATSSVWKARDVELGRVVALKALLGSGVHPDLASRFEREGTILGRLSHPNLVPVYASGNHDGRPYLVMELVDGVPFDEVLADGPLPVDDALGVVADVAAGLGAAHRAGVVHRDVKPANIVCGTDGTPRLVDFGIARAGDLTTMTSADSVMGTAAYLSPEQARGQVPGPATDVYALGCVLYQALTGAPPFEADSALAVAYRHVHDEPVPPRQLRPEVPAAVETVVLRALAKAPAQRYEDAARLEADLRRVRAGEAPEAMPVTTAIPAVAGSTMILPAVGAEAPELIDPSPLASPEPRAGRRWGIAAAAAAAVVVLGLALSGLGGDGDGQRPAGATDDPPTTTTTVATTAAPVVVTEPPPPPEPEPKGKAKGKRKQDDDDDDDD